MSIELTASNALQVHLPKGVAHGFQTLEANTMVHYVIEGSYSPESSCTIDPFCELEVSWPINEPLISDNDSNGMSFRLASQKYAESLSR
jgi:dTDP-4-dehydrorhamnose 3,5-epimerase